MQPLSVVIITKNESVNITDCIHCARRVSSDIIVADSGSEDDTVALAMQAGARVIQVNWSSYGHARNSGASNALNPWILALDADERVSPEMAVSIMHQSLLDEHTVYGFRRQNYFSGQQIRFGSWGNDKVFRLYHRLHAQWNDVPVHETLVTVAVRRLLLKGALMHDPAPASKVFNDKIHRYAPLVALGYYRQKKKSTLLKRVFSPFYAFFQSYILRLGFLDGRNGFIIARLLKKYTALKYRHLHLLYQNKQPGTPVSSY